MLIGRKEEQRVLHDAAKSEYSEFVAVYGRRRVGKTFLVRETFGYRFTFQHAGVANGNLATELSAFSDSLSDAGLKSFDKPKNWMEAFNLLKEVIRQSNESKKIIFIDELSWMDTPNSSMIQALENFWNGWASARKDVLLIVCASATSWIIDKVVHNKGGLYNRLTAQIYVRPFTLAECREYIKERNIVFDTYQILECYMIMGGIPYYWKLLKKGLSLAQNIDDIFFTDKAPLKNEFDYLYASLFRNPEDYISIVSALGSKKTGMTRDEIIAATGLANSGGLSKKLEELESCDFIRKYHAFGNKKKGTVYQLIDNYTLFYFKFLSDGSSDPRFWSNSINTPKINAWSGLAFERVCLLHVDCIKEKLGISGVLTEVNAWSCAPNPDNGIFGSQIDLLIVRADRIIDVCEMKYCALEYTVTEKFTMSMRRKISDLINVTHTKYAIHPIIATPYGIIDNAYAGEVQAVITAEDLFKSR